MPKIIFRTKVGKSHEIDATVGSDVMKEALTHHVEGITAECGGAAACGTCHVYVDEATLARLPPPESTEEAMLDFTAEKRAINSRLSCQLRVTQEMDGAVFTLPDVQF